MATIETIEELKRELMACAATDPDIGQRVMAVIHAYAPAVSSAWESRKYVEGEELIGDWNKFMDEHEAQLSPNGKLLARGQLNHSAGLFWQMRASFEYYLSADYVDSPGLFERAEGCFERALASFEKIDIPSDNKDFMALRERTVAELRASLLDARGMKQFTQGEFELEAGALSRAQDLLDKAVTSLRAGGEATRSANADEMPYLSPLHFVDYAQATAWRAKSDQALLNGDLMAAAEAEMQRAGALERGQAMHARAGVALAQVNEYFVRRLGRDAYVARQRHDRLTAAAAAQPRFEWLRSLLFFVLAMLPLAALIYWTAKVDVTKEPWVLAILIFYLLAVAGVGSRLVKWKEAADWFKDSIPKSKGS